MHTQVGKFAARVIGKKKKQQEEALEVAAEAVVAGPEAGTEDDEWGKGELVGRACRMVDEQVPATCGAPAKILGQKGEQLCLEVQGLFHSVLCKVEQADLLPQLKPSWPEKALQLNKAEKVELIFKFPMLDPLGDTGLVNGDHIMLGAWTVTRDVCFREWR